jgi:hypothetical protein
MGYSQEFIDWTKATDLTASHSISESSTLLAPETSNDEVCDGIGYIGMSKDSTGQLFMKMKSDNEQGFEMVIFGDVLAKYFPGDLTPTE